MKLRLFLEVYRELISVTGKNSHYKSEKVKERRKNRKEKQKGMQKMQKTKLNHPGVKTLFAKNNKSF